MDGIRLFRYWVGRSGVGKEGLDDGGRFMGASWLLDLCEKGWELGWCNGTVKHGWRNGWYSVLRGLIGYLKDLDIQ